jgi:hypothetical protein
MFSATPRILSYSAVSFCFSRLCPAMQETCAKSSSQRHGVSAEIAETAKMFSATPRILSYSAVSFCFSRPPPKYADS